MNGRLLITLSAMMVAGIAVAQSVKQSELTNAYATRTYQRQAVHDPSIVVDDRSEAGKTTYYVFGSHVAGAKSTDMVNWTWVGAGEQNTTANSWFGKLSDGTSGTASRCVYSEAYNTNVVTTVKNVNGKTVNFGNYNAHDWQSKGYTVAGNEWAPDVIYNPTMGKWLMYMSVNGDKWESVIVCLASDNVTGPYIYQGPVVYSGFHGYNDHVGYTKTDDYKKMDLEIALGEQTSLPARYNVGKSWGTYWPNCIDPCVFYDDNGRLLMSYGSWSGGIFMLELDETTGLRDYTVKYDYKVKGTSTSLDAAADKACTEDPYFGKKIAGGCYVSGEASYIEKIGDYHFLFMSNGGLESNGGYEMRIYRSLNPDGPYVDVNGISSIYDVARKNFGADANTNRGQLLMSNYKWDTMPYAEVAQGHNSATTDSKGRQCVVYHTRTNDGTEGHSVRVHQMWLNEDGWLVTSPYEMNDEAVQTQATIASTTIEASEMAGDWQIIRHQYYLDTANKAYQKPLKVTMTADGKLTAEDGQTGTWSIKAGTSYVTLILSGVAYKGVVSHQVIDYTNIKALCISALSSSSGKYTSGKDACTKGVELWASKADSKAALAYTIDHMSGISEGMTTGDDITLPEGLMGTTITWTSDNESVMEIEGQTGVRGTEGQATLTATIAKDGMTTQKSYTINVGESTTAVYYPSVGGTSLTWAYNVAFSDFYALEKGKAVRLVFYNYSAKTQNYDNWLLGVSSQNKTKSMGADVCDYFTLRADHYGWGNYYNVGNIVSAYDWNTFRSDMDGALVDMTVKYDGNKVTMECTETTTSGKVMNYSFSSNEGITADVVYVLLSVEKAYLVGNPPSQTPVDDIMADPKTDDEWHDLSGRRIIKPSRGLFIHNGKLTRVK